MLDMWLNFIPTNQLTIHSCLYEVRAREVASRQKRGKREYLNDFETKALLDKLNAYFEIKMEVKRIRNGEHQTLEMLINEEALLVAKYLRREIKSWAPRIAFLPNDHSHTASLKSEL